MDPLQLQKVKRKIMLLFAVIIAVCGLYFVYSRGFIEVRIVNSNQSGEIGYNLKGPKDIAHSSNELSIKRFVKRGSYELKVTQNNQSYVGIAETGGFLSTTAIQVRLVPERAREFIGDNPFACMQYAEGVLLTIPCGSSINMLQAHIPATDTTPGFVQKSRTAITGYVEGMVTMRDGAYVLVKAPPQNEDQGSAHTLYRLTAEAGISDGVALTDLREDSFYSLQPFQNGFIVYDNDFQDIKFYDNARAQPVSVKDVFTLDSSSNIKPQLFRAGLKRTALLFSNNTEGEIHDHHESSGRGLRSSLITRTDSSHKTYTFKQYFNDIQLCGQSLLCAQSSNEMFVYDISGNKAIFLYKISDVQSIHSIREHVLIVSDSGVIRFDPTTRSGSIDYSFGSLRYCGLGAVTDDSYTICTIGFQAKKSALKVMVNSSDSDSIDKKIFELASAPFIQSISVYRNFVFISPDAGGLVPDPITGEFGYDPNEVRQASAAIVQKVRELGIDNGTYTIINTLGN